VRVQKKELRKFFSLLYFCSLKISLYFSSPEHKFSALNHPNCLLHLRFDKDTQKQLLATAIFIHFSTYWYP